jgi:anti-sigma factor RsiW
VPDAEDDRYELPVTVDLLADLQAGLLDDRTAARLRRRVRTDPAVKAQLAALDSVRRNLSALAVDSASAPDVPADVTATICRALRSAPPPTP